MQASARALPGSAGGLRPIRVLIVDDSAVARAALSHMIETNAEFRVAAALDGARRAIDWLRADRADVILLDLEMPGIGGLAALPELLAVSRGAHVLVVSTVAAEGAAATVRALALGATDTLAKPAVGSLGAQFAATLIDRMERLGRAKAEEALPIAPMRATAFSPVACLAIGASTGGLHALAALFAKLPPGFDPPILVTQHLPPAFMPYFADQLATLSGRPAQIAAEGVPIERGRVFIAPGNAHLGCIRSGYSVRATLLTHEVASRCRPSVDPMFVGVAAAYGVNGVGVVLSGMGRDGLDGAEALVRAGGTVMVQDAASSAVWGMPGSVARAGFASLVATPQRLASAIARRGVA